MDGRTHFPDDAVPAGAKLAVQRLLGGLSGLLQHEQPHEGKALGGACVAELLKDAGSRLNTAAFAEVSPSGS